MQKKRFAPTVRALIIIISGAALLAAVLLVILLGQKMISKPVELMFSPESEYAFTKTGFLFKSGGNVKYTDLSDNTKYTGQLPRADMKLAGYGRDSHAVYIDNTLCIIGLEEAIFTEGQIEDVFCGDGYIACLINDGGERYISVYNLNGENVEEVRPDDMIIMYGFTHSGKEQLYVVTLNTDSDALVSTVTTYDPSAQALTGIITVQDQLVEDIVFTKRSVFISGTSNLIRYDAKDNKESYRLIKRGYRMAGFYESGDKVIFMMQSNDGGQNSVRLYSASQSTVPQEKIVPFQLPENTLGVFVRGTYIYAVTQNVVYMYNQNGVQKAHDSLDVTIDSVYPTGNDTFTAASGSRLYSFTITGINDFALKLRRS